ncbi:hypothetical protein AB0F88_03655 [Streptosporangium sp. NPDC023963]|uniref:hypothetical protein n=1 Tax=Streptosporangium sp. NPDC023963 TaxID=3155608 RepID=UPI003444C381
MTQRAAERVTDVLRRAGGDQLIVHHHSASYGRAYLGLARGTWLGAAGIAQPRPLTVLAEAAEVV